MKDEIRGRFDQNLDRAHNLIVVYEGLAGSGSGRRAVAESDLLRAAVVFLHAALEDLLRTAVSWKLPQVGDSDAIDQVPLVDISQFNRPQKFQLGHLVHHKGKTVDSLIGESVAKYLDGVSFNNATDISNAVQGIGIDINKVNSRFGDLDELMKRRHHIVHQADFNSEPGTGHHVALSIRRGTVLNWLGIVREFGNQLIDEL